MKKLLTVFFLTVFSIISFDASALQSPRPISTDSRIRMLAYSPNEVYKLIGHYGYQSMIEFGADETIATISIGDSVAWQVVPAGNRIFIKPVEPDATTNMTVVSDKHIYNFELHAEQANKPNAPNMVFNLRFIYPEQEAGGNYGGFINQTRVPEPELENDPQKYNEKYSISGANDNIAPIRIFDDGEFTYFKFRNKNANIPAFFVVDSQGRESVINYRTVGDYIVVERVASQFTLRDGKDIICVFNEAAPLQLDEDRDDGKFLGLF